MKTKNPILLPALIAGLGLMLAGRVTAQTFTTLHSFTALNNSTNSDGAYLEAGLVLSGHFLYGTTYNGGSSGSGTVFALNTDGTGFTTRYSFTAASAYPYTNSDGSHPYANVVLSKGMLYGTTEQGGSSGAGTLFKLGTDGIAFTNIHNLNSATDGAAAVGLVPSGSTVYGTAAGGGSGGGTVFKVGTDGLGFTNLHSFASYSDGANPYDGMVLSGSTLYGTASAGGSSGAGTIFKINTDGNGFIVLKTFLGGLDGRNPQAQLVLSGSTLYGTAADGGSAGNGTVFAINTDGTGFTNLHSFATLSLYTNSDGAHPYPFGGLVVSGNTLYGTANAGGSSGNGTVFAINTDGTGFTTLYSFTARSGVTNSDGASPYAGLVLSGSTLYGTASVGGSSGSGTVFSLSFAPQLTIIPSAGNVVLTWPTNVAGFDYTGYKLQSTTNLAPPAVWTPLSPPPVVINGQNTVTNPISGAQQFYRLSQ